MIAFFWISCAEPVACDQMCGALVTLQEACLQEAGLGWETVGQLDAAGLSDSCHTWVWVQNRLAADAELRPTEAVVAEICSERSAILSDPDADFQDLAMSWE